MNDSSQTSVIWNSPFNKKVEIIEKVEILEKFSIIIKYKIKIFLVLKVKWAVEIA